MRAGKSGIERADRHLDSESLLLNIYCLILCYPSTLHASFSLQCISGRIVEELGVRSSPGPRTAFVAELSKLTKLRIRCSDHLCADDKQSRHVRIKSRYRLWSRSLFSMSLSLCTLLHHAGSSRVRSVAASINILLCFFAASHTASYLVSIRPSQSETLDHRRHPCVVCVRIEQGDIAGCLKSSFAMASINCWVLYM